MASNCENGDFQGTLSEETQIGLASSEYREGSLFYGFDTEEALSSWAMQWSDEPACYAMMLGAVVIETLPASSYLVMNIDTDVVLFSPQDLMQMQEISFEFE